MQEALAVAATEIGECRCIAIAGLRPHIDLVSQCHILAIVEAIIHAIRSITVWRVVTIRAGCLYDRLFAAEERLQGNCRRDGCDSGRTFDETPSAHTVRHAVVERVTFSSLRRFFPFHEGSSLIDKRQRARDTRPEGRPLAGHALYHNWFSK